MYAKIFGLQIQAYKDYKTEIDSQRSVLILQPKSHSVEIIEKLYEIQCWSQEKLYNNPNAPMYQMRALQAKEGVYKYETQTFEATDDRSGSV